MKSLCSFLLFAIGVAIANSSNLISGENPDAGRNIGSSNLDHVPLNNSKVCGRQVLDGEGGRIEYKVAEALEENERCVWVIRVANATGFAVGIFSLGFPQSNSDHKLTVTSFHGQDSPETTTLDHVGMYDFNEANVLIVTFHSGVATNATGFTLEYTTFFQGSSSLESGFALFHDAAAEGKELFYPTSSSHSNTLGFYIRYWPNNTFVSQRSMRMTYVRRTGWGAGQSVEVYAYSPVNSWQLRDKFQYNAGDPVGVVESQEMLIFVYRKDGSHPESTYFTLVNFVCKD